MKVGSVGERTHDDSFILLYCIDSIFCLVALDPDAWKQQFMIESNSGAAATDDERYV